MPIVDATGGARWPGIVVNGEPRDLQRVPLHTNALDFLRGCGLTGAKEGCAEGECGACSVMVARPAPTAPTPPSGRAINSCLRARGRLDGQEVVTSEGLGTPDAPAPGPARDGGARRLAVRLLHARVRLLAWPPSSTAPAAPPPTAPGPHDAYHGDNGFDLHALSGNLCRCTGYRPIKDAAFALGFPAADDELAPAYGARAGADATQLHDGEAALPPPARSAEALQILARPRGRHRRRRQHRLGRRGQPQRPPGRARRGRRPADRAARLVRRSTTSPDRRRPHAHRGRAPARRPLPLLAR
jgi:xanthine dehydrogenase small subunit